MLDDKPAPNNAETLQALKSKHPNKSADYKPAGSFTGNARFQPLQVSPEDVIRCLRTFLARSSGGPDGHTAQHLRDILAGAPDERLTSAITDFVNLLLNGELLLQVREIIFGGRLIALQKKDGGIRSIAVSYTLRRLAAKCANSFVIKRRSEEFQPIQVGAGVSGGAEAAVHAVRRLVEHLPDDQVMVKLDFTNERVQQREER